MKSTTPQFDNSRFCLFRIADRERKALEKLVFLRHPRREWGSFFCFGFRRTSWGLAVSFVEALPPKSGDLDRLSPVVQIHPDYIARVLRAHEAGMVGVGFIHSHPGGIGTSPSFSDDDMDFYFAELFEQFGQGRPYCSLILNKDSGSSRSFSGRTYDGGSWMPVTQLLCPGFPLLKVPASDLGDAGLPTTLSSETGESTTARLDSLVTEQGRQRLAAACVGVIGCSGTGSPAVEALARAQVGEFLLVDYDRFSPSNLERMHGSSYRDTLANPKPLKVEILTRLIREVNPSARITALAGNLLDPEVFDQALRCDLLLGCTDTQHGRAVLGDLAVHYLVPSIDVGVLMKGGKGGLVAQLVDVTRYQPDLPCPFCTGVINNWWLACELMSREERVQRKAAAQLAAERGENADLYWGGEPPRLPTVGYLTTNAGSLVAGYAVNWLAGTGAMPHSRFQYDVGAPSFGFVSVPRERKPGCSCSRTIGHADQADASVTRPTHWPAAWTTTVPTAT